MQKTNQLRLITCLLFSFVFLVTLFFGLKSKGYRFINQVSWPEKSSCLAFTNIGMVYSEKTLGDVGITDSITLLFSLRPHGTGKQLSKIITIVDENSDEILTIEQWMAVLMATLYDSAETRIAKAGINALSSDSVKQASVTLNSSELTLSLADLQQSSVSVNNGEE